MFLLQNHMSDLDRVSKAKHKGVPVLWLHIMNTYVRTGCKAPRILPITWKCVISFILRQLSSWTQYVLGWMKIQRRDIMKYRKILSLPEFEIQTVTAQIIEQMLPKICIYSYRKLFRAKKRFASWQLTVAVESLALVTSHPVGSRFRYRPGNRLFWIRFFVVFVSNTRQKHRQSQSRPRSLSFSDLPIHLSLIILRSDETQLVDK
jgi:hypothetical protein